MSAQEKYQSLLELANQNGTTYELSEGEGGTLIVTGTAIRNVGIRDHSHARSIIRLLVSGQGTCDTAKLRRVA